MLRVYIKLFLSTLKDAFFCTCLLFLCFNPYSGLSEIARVLTTFFSFVLYLLLPRIISKSTYEPLIKTVDYNRISEQKETFIATISHDMKAPLLSQITSLNLLLKGEAGKLNYEQTNIVKANLNSCNFLMNMALSILATYRFENGQTVLKIREFDSVSMIENCINEFKNLAKENNQTFELKFQMPKTRFIWADELQIKRVIVNLISNAIKYGFENTKIEINAINEDGFFRFYIEGCSPFMPDKKLRLLFKKFTSPYLRNSKSGTGLGLYLSRKIIEAHGGNIMVESFEDNRNQFGFMIPSDNSEEANEIRKSFGRVMFR